MSDTDDEIDCLQFGMSCSVYADQSYYYYKKYVLWNAGICPIASKVGHVTLVTPPLESFIVPYVVFAMAYPTKKKRKV